MTGLVDDLDRIPRFDEFLRLGADETEAAVRLLAPALDAGRKRARKENEDDHFNQTVGLVVANTLASGEVGIHYSRRYQTYSGASPYKPPWLGSKRFLGVVDGLAEEGLVEVEEGRWAGVFSEGKGQEASLRGTPLLVEELKAIGIDLQSVDRDQENAPVIKKKDHARRLIRYDPSDEYVVQRSKELKIYNGFIEGQDILLPGEKTPSFSALARTYNEDSWERGGRHFAGWWQQIPSAQRAKLLIDRKETVELDFSGFNTRALYHLSGQKFEGDVYDIPEIRRLFEDQGIDWEAEGRGVVKNALNILIGARSDKAIYKMVEKFPDPKVPLNKFVPLIRKYHAPIREFLGKGMSTFLINRESVICNEVILNGMSSGLIILPVFDSFITTSDKEEYLMDLMSTEYQKVMKFDPTIH